MVRTKRGKETKRKHKKIISKTKGMKGVRRSSIKKAKEATMKAGQYAYRDRRTKKRQFKRLWIIRLNNAVRERGLKYSEFISLCKNKKVELDRKILSEIAVKHPEIFDKIIIQIKK